MDIITSQILKFMDSPKTQKSKYTENGIFSLRIKVQSLYTNWYNMAKKFSSGGNLKIKVFAQNDKPSLWQLNSGKRHLHRF